MKKNIFWVIGIGCLLSCSNEHKNLYDPDSAIKQYEENWKNQIGDIDPDQTWNMAMSRRAEVILVEDALSDYQIQLFTANPIHGAEAMLMASYNLKTDVSGMGKVSFNFDIPQGLQYVYAARVDSHNRRSVQLIKVGSEDVLNIRFGKVESRAAVGGVDYEIPSYATPYADEAAVEAEINNGYIEISKGNDFWNNSAVSKIAWRLSDTQDLPYFNYQHNKQLNSFLIVIEKGGVLNFNQNNINIEDQITKFDIIVKSGGKLQMNDKGALGKARLVVLPGGEVMGNTLQTGLAQGSEEPVDGIYNAGTINVQHLYLMNGNIYNNNTVKITELHAPNGGTFVNNGKVLCEKAGISGNQALILKTNCLFRCTQHLKCNEIWVGSNAAVEVPVIEIYGALYLNKNSIIRADEASMGNTAINAPAGSDDYALISFKKLGTYFTNNDGSNAPISGNLYFEYNEIGGAAEHWKNRIDYLIERANNNGGECVVQKVGEASLSIPGNDYTNIEDADCAGKGNTPDNNIEPTPTNAMTWTLAYEDLGSIGDFDFNDVVLRVSHVSGENDAAIILCAAGGTLATDIYYDNTYLGEVHQKFNVSSTVMVNTGGISRDFVELGKPEVGPNFSLSKQGGKFRIMVTKQDHTTTDIALPSGAGEVPQVICVDGKWAWPAEATSIDKAYEKFGKWGANYIENPNWHDTVTGSVINK